MGSVRYAFAEWDGACDWLEPVFENNEFELLEGVNIVPDDDPLPIVLAERKDELEICWCWVANELLNVLFDEIEDDELLLLFPEYTNVSLKWW